MHILFKILCTVNFLHEANIVHRDIKPCNFLINDQYKVLLCDFGLARTLPKVETKKKEYSREKMAEKLTEIIETNKNSRRHLSNHVVTRAYRPPEIILQEKKYHSSVDIWGIGCILGELIKKQDDY